jgi:hypothetical protein
VTGRSALDNAVASTQRLIESLERAADRLSSPEIATHAYTGGALAYSR